VRSEVPRGPYTSTDLARENGGGRGARARERRRRGSVPVPETALQEAYGAYRRREARRLLELLPRNAVRPLHGRALEWAESGGRVKEEDKDPLAVLVAYCERLLPLPPFSVWLRDLERHRPAHLRRASRDPDRAGEALPLETRSIRADEREWWAVLSLVPRGRDWSGYISFHPAGDGRSFRTAEIFREPEADRVIERFRSFHESSLCAFLRSARP